MARPEGGYRSERRGAVDIIRNPEDHTHGTPDELLACITLASGRRSMVLDQMHGPHPGGTRAAHAIGLG